MGAALHRPCPVCVSSFRVPLLPGVLKPHFLSETKCWELQEYGLGPVPAWGEARRSKQWLRVTLILYTVWFFILSGIY